ncbi:RPB3 [Enterospora canceri]|uniref:RPB3 n=1 Tax=Enterospora canceri TaxID=1081671 RepID=A0A1Y1S8Z1_9MICR|nr:RPB3 [Enterospora canceri]
MTNENPVNSVKFEFIELTETSIKFALQCNVSFANGLRRILLGELATLAIDYVEITENTSVFADEMVANRLGLLPLDDRISLIEKDACDCDEHCEKCAVVFQLNRTNNTVENMDVLGRDLTNSHGLQMGGSNVLICKLAPKQSIKLRCVARRESCVSANSRHAKFSPVTAVAFSYDEENVKKHTVLWKENNETVGESWPFVNEDSGVYDLRKVERVVMNVEVVEGVGKPKEILKKGLELYKKKFERILDA